MRAALMIGALACAPLPADVTPADERPALPDQNPGDRVLSSRLRHIEAAFRGGDAGLLRGSFTSGTRIRVELPDLRDGRGAYSGGQLQVIFARIFDDFRTREFSFATDDVQIGQRGTAFARGRWVRRGRPAGPETTDTLTFTLRQEGGDWRILEIRASR